jgi:hypothetical protein
MPKRGPKRSLGFPGSFPSACGSCTQACHNRVCPCRQLPLAHQSSRPRRSPKSVPPGPMMGHSVRRAGRAYDIWRSRNTSTPGAPWRRDPPRGPLRGEGMGYAGYNQQGAQVLAILDHTGSVFAPIPVASVTAPALVLLLAGLRAWPRLAKEVGWGRRGAWRNLGGGCDAAHHRQCLCHAGLIPPSPSIPATAHTPSADASGAARLPSMRGGCVAHRPWCGKPSASGSCDDLDTSSSGIMA